MKHLATNRFVMILLFLALGTNAYAVDIPKVGDMLNEKNLSELLNKGSLVIIHKKGSPNGPQFISAGALIQASPDRVWNVITDFDSYQQFMPQTKKVSVKNRKDNALAVDYQLYFKFTVIKMSIHYVLLTHLQPPFDMWWTIDAGEDNDMKESLGRWEIIPLGTDKAAAFYTIYSDLKSMGKVVNFFLKEQPQLELAIQVSTGALVVNSVKQRAESPNPAATTPAK